MTTQTITLTDFVLARIAEHEAAARKSDPTDVRRWAHYLLWARFSPARVLADCKAKRRIVGLTERADFAEEDRWEEQGVPAAAGPFVGELILRQLALPDADHPDYREEWRP